MLIVVLLRYVQNMEEKKRILHACQVDIIAGHMGRTRTLYKIKERFMWHGIVKDVQDMVRYNMHITVLSMASTHFDVLQLSKCDVCQGMN